MCCTTYITLTQTGNDGIMHVDDKQDLLRIAIGYLEGADAEFYCLDAQQGMNDIKCKPCYKIKLESAIQIIDLLVMEEEGDG